jgi:hypothetical protein
MSPSSAISFISCWPMFPDGGQEARARQFDAVLREATASLGLDAADARPLRLHGSGIYLLPREGMVARLIEATDENRRRADAAVQVTGWLAAQGFAATEPAYGAVTEFADTLITFWWHLAQPDQKATLPVLAAALGGLLRELHGLPSPPFDLPTVDPLVRLRRALMLDAGRQEPVLADDARAFLDSQMAATSEAYAALDFPLGHGLLHNDAHIDNLLIDERSRHGYVLGDWEGACIGPREIDLVQEGAPGNRFGESEELRQAFSQAYGYDIAGWPGWRVLRRLRDLHSLAAYIRTASAKPAAGDELRNRLGSLRNDDRTRLWRAVA